MYYSLGCIRVFVFLERNCVLLNIAPCIREKVRRTKLFFLSSFMGTGNARGLSVPEDGDDGAGYSSENDHRSRSSDGIERRIVFGQERVQAGGCYRMEDSYF